MSFRDVCALYGPNCSIDSDQGRIQKYGLGGAWRRGVSSPPRPSPSPPLALPVPSSPLPLEVGPLIQLGGLGSAVSSPSGNYQPILHLVHFSLKIWHLVATILDDFPVKFSRNKRKRQPIWMLGRSGGNHDWLLANASACVSCGFRLRNARNASDCVWMQTGRHAHQCSNL